MKIFILFFSLFLPLMGVKAQTIRDINTRDVPKYKIKFRPISIDPKLGTIRNPNEYLEDIELDTIVKSIASIVSNSSDLGKPINYATQAALLAKADKTYTDNLLNLKFDKAGGTITGDIALRGNVNYAGGAKITVSPDGKSISIKPGGTAGTAIKKPPVELYVAPIAIQEDSVRGYLYKGKQLFKQTFHYTDVTSSTVILSNIQDVYQLQGTLTYTTANGNVVSYNLQNMITTGLALLKYLITPGTLTINPYDCGNCTNQNFTVTAQYTKRL